MIFATRPSLSTVRFEVDKTGTAQERRGWASRQATLFLPRSRRKTESRTVFASVARVSSRTKKQWLWAGATRSRLLVALFQVSPNPWARAVLGSRRQPRTEPAGNCHGGLPRARVTCELDGDVACTDKRSNRPDEREGELSSTGNCHPLNGVSRPNRRDCHDQAKSVATPSRSEEEQKIGKLYRDIQLTSSWSSWSGSGNIRARRGPCCSPGRWPSKISEGRKSVSEGPRDPGRGNWPARALPEGAAQPSAQRS